VNKVLHLSGIIHPQTPTHKTSEGIVSLKVNQLLTAKILEIFPDQTAKILYNGATLHAKLEAPLAKGNRYLFEVLESTGSIILKKVNGDPLKSNNEQILQKFHLTLNENNKKAVDFAISEKIPLTKENVKLVADILQLTPTVPLKVKKEVMHRMIELQLPVKPETVSAVAAISTMKHTGQSEMKDLFKELLPVVQKDKTFEKTVVLLQRIFGFEAEETSMKSNPQSSSITLNDDEGYTDERVLVNQKPAPLETKGQAAVINRTNDVMDVLSTNDQKLIHHPSAEKGNPSAEFLQAAKKWIQSSGLLHERNIFFDPLQVKQMETLKSQLLFILQNTDSLELTESILQKTEQALNKLTSQQLQNLPSNDSMQQFILQIPFGQDVQPKEITIRWEGKKQKENKLDPAHCRMLFWLEMERIKDVAVDVQIQNRILSLKVYCEHPLLEKLSASLVPTLKKSLKEMNYTLSSIQFINQQKDDISIKDINSTYKGMDLRI
jgi:hypothetical protein